MKPVAQWSRLRAQASRRQRGAALLLAMVVVTVVAALAGTMIWQQWRLVEMESSERSRDQAHWVLSGALDWARLILREDARGSQIDHLGEPWALPLQESRLSTFLSGGREDLEQNESLQAFLSGAIIDAQSRFNLRNLVVNGQITASSERRLQRLCEAAGVPSGTAALILAGARRSWLPVEGAASGAGRGSLVGPERVTDLGWWGLEPAVIERLRPWIVILPAATALNINTASAEVMAVVIEGVDLSTAQRLVQARNTTPFRSTEQALALLPKVEDPNRAASMTVQSAFFEVQGRLRLGERSFEERLLVERRQLEVVVLQQERVLPSSRPERPGAVGARNP